MVVQTKILGEIEIEDDKIIVFENGLIGFPEMKQYALVFDDTKDQQTGDIIWLQSMEEPDFSVPVMNPLHLEIGYDPLVNDELLASLGVLTPENTFVLITIRIPEDITNMTVNLRAPLIINMDTRKACQLIVENEEYAIKYPIYELLQKRMEGVCG